MSNLRKWADEHQYDAAPMQAHRDEYGNIIPKVTLLWMTPDPLGAMAAMCRMYEGLPTYDLSTITDDERLRYLEQVQKTHLKAPLESIKLHFFIEGVTRSFTHQMVRQRTAVYAQESLRFAVKGESWTETVSLPPSLAGTVQDSEDDPGFMSQQQRNRDTWDRAVRHAEQAYKLLVESGMPAEDARGLMPHAMTTRLNYITDLRNLIEHAGNRLCTQAQFEWRIVFMGIVKAISDAGRDKDGDVVDWQYDAIASSGMFRPICYQLGRCQFNADFDRSCTIRKRVDAFADAGVQSYAWGGNEDGEVVLPNGERLDAVHVEEWLANPAAARKQSGGAGHD